MEILTPYERGLLFLKSEGDVTTKLKTLLFLKNELNHVNQTQEILIVKEVISCLVDVICAD